jgi:DnaA family protein
MSQLALDLVGEVEPTLDNFVAGSNRECLQCLRGLLAGERRHRFIYLWGLPGSGRSHLARAMGAANRAGTANRAGAATDPSATLADARLETDDHVQLEAHDDVHLLGADEQARLFARFIAAAADPGLAIVCTGDRPPLALALRDDLRSRLGAGLVFELHAPDDAGRAQALALAARERGLAPAPDLIPWLLTHHARDLRVLMSTLEALDRYALARQRPLTLPLLREWLACQGADPGG